MFLARYRKYPKNPNALKFFESKRTQVYGEIYVCVRFNPKNLSAFGFFGKFLISRETSQTSISLKTWKKGEGNGYDGACYELYKIFEKDIITPFAKACTSTMMRTSRAHKTNLSPPPCRIHYERIQNHRPRTVRPSQQASPRRNQGLGCFCPLPLRGDAC